MDAIEPRAGYHSVTPRLVVSDVEAQVEFLRAVFDATGDVVSGRPAEIRLGDSLVPDRPPALTHRSSVHGGERR